MEKSVISNTDTNTDTNTNTNNENIKIVEVIKIVYKYPECLLKARRNHYNKKKIEDPEYLEKEKERIRKYRELNRDHVNELARIRRQKKKAEEKAKQEKLTNNETIKSNDAKEDLPNLDKLIL